MVALGLAVEELARIRVMSTLGLAAETYFAWQRYTEPQSDVFTEWRKKTRSRLRRMMAAGTVVKTPRPLMESVDPDSQPARDFSPREKGELSDGNAFQGAAVRPYWKRIALSLETERTARGRDVLENGMEGVLNALHPAISWEAPVLRIADGHPDREVSLGGRRLTLVPSLFAQQPLVLDSALGPQDSLLLVYNITPDPAGAAALWQDEPTDSALPSLLGRTRADVMECLRETGSTGEIARRLKISNPSVSQHIGVLRRAGLVATERRNNASVHTLTPLGEAVLG
ncbi:Syd protein [Streptomyces sp. NBRC 110611]|uniref:ArsR/SmtB family transcription factor n=1 Tax=Streptomyces sp. NBRC 110611 TaxID=1621259 RepID=UPI0008375776|nr:helix-turn-helix domain-containing protein [Streptomyces sp. NBRC 110611]GAU67915.1 Syd protein [Streptomyces sp. NBRC 110611]